MPSPFPGMDPYIEDYTWPEFHMRLALEISNVLVKQLPDDLTVEVEVTAFTETLLVPTRSYRPDVAVRKNDEFPGVGYVEDTGVMVAPETTPADLVMTWRTDIETLHRTVQVRSVNGGRLVAAIEILSPANKRGEGLKQYRQKRKDYEEAGVHLLEIDLLRTGTRSLPLPEAAEATYQVQVSNANNGTLLTWLLNLNTPLPVVGLPLLPDTDDLPLDLPTLFAKVYEDAGYTKRLNYSLPLRPPLVKEADATFIAGLSFT